MVKDKKLKITQVKSLIGTQRDKHRTVMTSLGFRKNQTTLYKNDTPQIRGMIEKVRHLVVWSEIDAKDVPVKTGRSAGFTVVDSKGAASGTKRAKKSAKKRVARKSE
jgi:large subunit ribosomal protein L30